jgi:hypothetical protein
MATLANPTPLPLAAFHLSFTLSLAHLPFLGIHQPQNRRSPLERDSHQPRTRVANRRTFTVTAPHRPVR